MASNGIVLDNNRRIYEYRGAQYNKERGLTTFRVYAPNAKSVNVILTAYGREEMRINMTKVDKGVWEVISDKAPPGRTYLYLIEDCKGKRMLRTDPVSFSTIDISEVNQIQSVVYDRKSYIWNDEQWMTKRAFIDPLRSPLSIYEMQPKSWKSGVYQPINYREIVPQLAEYCQEMGFTHVEVYGLLEHSRKTERGYQVSNFFSPYHDNGQCDDLKYFVDYLHIYNIGVILDWIPTHFHHYHPSDSFSFSLHEFDGTNLHGNEESCWGTLYFDYNKEETYQLLFGSALYFLDEIHIDGIRFDAVSSMIRRQSNDISIAIRFLRQLNVFIHEYYPGVLSIAEETDGYPNLTKTMDFDLKWNFTWSSNAMNFLRTPYHQRQDHWQEKILDFLYSSKTNSDRTILTISHDDTDCHYRDHRLSLYNCTIHSNDELQRFSDLRNFFAWQTFSPSRGHMIHMGDEVAQPVSWFYRFRQGLSSIDWSLANPLTLHGQIQFYISHLNKLYNDHPQFWQNGEQDFTILYQYKPNLIVAYYRGIYNNRRLAIIHNFSNQSYRTYDISLPSSDPNVTRIQRIIEIFNSDKQIYGGSGLFQNENIQLRHRNSNERLLTIAIPALSTIVLEEHLA